jgi:mannitol 2-dehydrogenase
LGRIGTDGAARISEFVLPTVAEQLRRDGPMEIGAFTVAAWIRFLNGKDDLGGELPFADAMGEPLREIARRAGPDPSPILRMQELFGDLPAAPRFADAVNGYLHGFYEQGARATLTRCLENAP